MARGELMKKLITSYGRDDKFRTVVEQIIGEEELKGNRVLAGSLRKSLDRLGEGSTQTAPSSKLLPFPDEARDFIQRVEPQRTPAELHLSQENTELFAGIIREFRQADRLRRHGLEVRSKLLFCGPPGTGKTAFAEHVAEQLGRELISRSASGLLDKFIGETEKAIAGMFAEARSEGAVLLLDEADNFLRSREGANHRWEVTQTNELLVQMERFDGVFLCATNLLDAFDPAALRRFDVKLGFGYLGPEQRWRLFDRLLEARGLALPDGEAQRTLRRRIGALECLTPGDLAAIARGTDLLDPGAEDASSLVERLEQDHWIKPDAGGRRVGFV